MMGMPIATAYLIRPHHGQVAGHEMFHNRGHIQDAVAIGPVDINTHLIKPLQWTRAHTAHHNGLDLGAMKDIHRHHTST